MPEIRRAQLADLDALVELAENYCRAHGEEPDRERVMATMRQQINGTTFFVYETDGEVKGGIALSEGHDALTGKPVIRKTLWYMDASASGYGLQLLRHAESYAKQIGIKQLWVSVEDERAFSLMEKRGYGAYETQFRKAL